MIYKANIHCRPLRLSFYMPLEEDLYSNQTIVRKPGHLLSESRKHSSSLIIYHERVARSMNQKSTLMIASSTSPMARAAKKGSIAVTRLLEGPGT